MANKNLHVALVVGGLALAFGLARPALAQNEDFWLGRTTGMHVTVACTTLCQECLYVDTYNPNDPSSNVPEVKMTNGILQKGELYLIEISGTASYWSPSAWTAPMGAFEAAPMFPSLAGDKTGPVGWDWEYLFGYPDQTYGDALPRVFNYGVMSTDGGGLFFAPTPITGQNYNPAHVYTFVVVGQGQKAAFERIDMGPTHDNYGRFKICVRHLTACNS